jgi:hypothetical protein
MSFLTSCVTGMNEAENEEDVKASVTDSKYKSGLC